MLHGLEATGKTSTTKAILESLSTSATNESEGSSVKDQFRYAIISSLECVSGRHLLEQAVGSAARMLHWQGSIPRCENLSQFAVELARMMEHWNNEDNEQWRRRFVLVFNGIDRQREAPSTLLPALARLSEIVSQPML